MVDEQVIKNIKVDQKYHVHFERAASANKTDGFKFEINGDDLETVKGEAKEAYDWAIAQLIPFPATPAKEAK